MVIKVSETQPGFESYQRLTGLLVADLIALNVLPAMCRSSQVVHGSSKKKRYKQHPVR